MAKGNTALGQELIEAHEAALNEAAQHCHFRIHAEKAIETYMSRIQVELEKRGFLLSVIKIQDEQDN